MLSKSRSTSTLNRFSLIRGLVTIAVISCMAWVSDAQAQNCATVVTDVQSLYDVGRTAEMITQLNRCLPDGVVEPAQKVLAYRFLSFAYIAEDQLPEAQVAVENLLDLNPNFEHDPTTDPPRFVEFVSASKDVRAQAQSKKSRKKRLFLIGGGTILAGALTAVIISSIGGTEPRVPLPDPPTFPDN